MANEITINGGLSVQRYLTGAQSAASSVAGAFQAQATLLNDLMMAGTQSFTTSAASVSMVSSAGYALIKNISATGNLLLYTDSGASQRFATLKPGEGIPIPAPAAMWAASSAGTVIAHVVSAKA